MHNEAFWVRENELNPWVRRRNGIKYLIYAPCQYFVMSLNICIGYHMRGEVISLLSLERRYHILSRVSAANEGQNMIS